MKISQLIITLILVCAIIVSFYSFQSNLAVEYNVTTDMKYQDDYNARLTRAINHSQTLENRTREDDGISIAKDKSFFTGTWDIFKITKDITVESMTISKEVSKDMVDGVGATAEGGYIYSVIIAILSILVVAAIIFIILKRVF